MRYEPFQWIQKRFFEKSSAQAIETEVAPVAAQVNDITLQLDAIEPAAGGGGGHGEPEATSEHGEKKSHTGKVLSGPPPLPNVTIGGKPVVSYAASIAKDVADTTPAGLKDSSTMTYLGRRFNVTPYVHSPTRGPHDAKIKVLEFVDLSCGQCMPELGKIDAALLPYASTTLVTSIHAPTARFQDTNMQAFYGKIAARGGVFWKYRDNLIQYSPQDSAAIFDELIKSGMELGEARTLMLNDARRFYRELDADSLLARSFGVSKPPILFVNGIRVGDGGIPLEKLSDIMKYVSERIERGLAEPPQ